jgi:hypothetical protein
MYVRRLNQVFLFLSYKNNNLFNNVPSVIQYGRQAIKNNDILSEIPKMYTIDYQK